MDYASWPTQQDIPSTIKDLLERCYSLLDTCDTYSRGELVDTIFSTHGEFHMNKRRLKGSKQINNWLRSCGEHITYRHHDVDKVYISDGVGDFMMMGTLTMGLEDGTTAETPFCARGVVDDVESEKPRLRSWQMWMDTTPFIDSGMVKSPSIPSGILDTIGGR